MPDTNRIDLWSIDYQALTPFEREWVKREAIGRAHAERARAMNAVFMAVPRLVRRACRRLTGRGRPVTIPGSKILQV